MNMKTRFVALSSLAFLLLTGCAGFNSSKHDRNAAFASEDLGELLRFQSDLANMTEASRAGVCQALLNRQKEAPSAGVQLHLLTGRMLSDDCGDISKILDGADSTPMKNLPDEQLKWLVTAQTEVLKRMDDLSRSLGALERKLKTIQCSPSAKMIKPESNKTVPKPLKEVPEPQKRMSEPPKDDSGLLRNKLDAIRSMENKLDDPCTGN